MTDQRSITPPPELFRQWEDDILNERDNVDHVLDCTWRHGFHAGADQELEACCEWMVNHFHGMKDWAAKLRAARRPKPPSLSEPALAVLDDAYGGDLSDNEMAIIRRALKRLQELEGND
jgi:hypothetical protein